MSMLLVSLAWDVQFPTHTQKLVMLKFADHASDNGEGIYPSNEMLAYQISCDKRTIQRCTKALESIGLLVKLSAGGTGPKATNQWSINVELLCQLAMCEMVIEGNLDDLKVVENKGDSLSPLVERRVTKLLVRVTQASLKGDAHVTQTLDNLSIEPNARERARDEPRASRAENAAAPLRMFELTPRDITWKAWLAEMEKVGRTDLADQAIDTGKIQVTSKWPDPDKGIQGLVGAKQKKTADITARITGDRSEGE